MKKTIKILGIIALVAVIGFTVIACNKGGGGGSSGGGGKLSGTYVNDSGVSWTFSGNKISNAYDGEVLQEGTYEIKDGKIYVTINGVVGEGMEFSQQGNTLTIGPADIGMVFTKK